MRMLKIILVLSLAGFAFGKVGNWAIYSTKTAYYWAHNVSEPIPDAEYQKTVDGNVCKAIHVTMLLRHGSRFPSGSSTDEIALLREELGNFTSGPKHQDVVNWQSNYSQDDADQLCREGEQEQFDIGRRTGLRYRSLFMNNGRYIKFVSSTKTRNTDSTRNFYHGLNSTVDGLGPFVNEINKTLMRYYDDCANYENEVEDNKTHMEEFTKYSASHEFALIHQKLQASLNYSITEDEVYLIYELCAYDKYIYHQISFWCDLLTDDDRDVLEYGQDLENYYQKSFTSPIIPKMTCPLMSDIFHAMDRVINPDWDYENLTPEAVKNGYLAGKFLDGHSTTVITMFTSLGLFNDSRTLLASNRAEMGDRAFRTSIISPYSASIEFALYVCDSGDASSNKTFALQLHVNEEPMVIPGCRDILCPYEQVRSIYGDLIDQCDINAVCNG